MLADSTNVVFWGIGSTARFNDAFQLEVSGTAAIWIELTSSGDTPSL